MTNFKQGLFGLMAVTALALGGCAASTNDGTMGNDDPTNTSADPAETQTKGGTCDLRGVDDTCSEYQGDVSEAKILCMQKGGVWSNQPCPDSNHVCCDWSGVHACAYTEDADESVFGDCMATKICDCGGW